MRLACRADLEVVRWRGRRRVLGFLSLATARKPSTLNWGWRLPAKPLVQSFSGLETKSLSSVSDFAQGYVGQAMIPVFPDFAKEHGRHEL